MTLLNAADAARLLATEAHLPARIICGPEALWVESPSGFQPARLEVIPGVAL